jgi:hypothetical protein
MSLRPPQSLAGGARPETGWNVLGHEIAQQKAEALGDMGRQVEEALARLRAFDASGDGGDPAARSRLVDAAADRVWALMVQREICGLRHWEAVVRNYGIPREVLVRMGRVTTRPPGAAPP